MLVGQAAQRSAARKPRRTLTRMAKDVVYVRQLGQCAYCLRHLDDAFEVDHLNECCSDDRWANLVACCGSCHNTKSRAYRFRHKDDTKARQLSEMLDTAVTQRAELWREFLLADAAPVFPPWLTARLAPGTLALLAAISGPAMGGVPSVRSKYWGASSV